MLLSLYESPGNHYTNGYRDFRDLHGYILEHKKYEDEDASNFLMQWMSWYQHKFTKLTFEEKVLCVCGLLEYINHIMVKCIHSIKLENGLGHISNIWKAPRLLHAILDTCERNSEDLVNVKDNTKYNEHMNVIRATSSNAKILLDYCTGTIKVGHVDDVVKAPQQGDIQVGIRGGRFKIVNGVKRYLRRKS